MPITALDPATALVVLDIQKGILAIPTAHPIATIMERAAALARAFRAAGQPVVLVTVTGRPPGRTDRPAPHARRAADWAEIPDAMGPDATDHLVMKRTPGAFSGTDLADYLASRGMTQIVLAGVATSNACEATAREAYALGYNVTLAIDAMTDSSAGMHDHTVRYIFPKIGETGSTDDILALLAAPIGS